MKKILPILTLAIAVLFLSGCSYKIVKDQTISVDKNTKINATIVNVGTFYNGEDGFSLSIPNGNNSTCVWTYEGGSASVPYSVTTKANTATEKHAITFASGTRDSYSNFKVSCVDDFGNQYVGNFPIPTYNNLKNTEKNNSVVSTQPASNNLATESANGMSCKKIAEQAANDYQKTNNRLATVLKSHYNQALKKCYYEFLISVNLAGSDSGSVSTDIRVSPDDDWIAECSTNVYPAPKLFCTQHNIGVITEQQFKQFEDTYFNN